MIQTHQKKIPYHRKDGNSAEREAKVSNPSPFVTLDKLVAMSLYLGFVFADTDHIISLSVCGKKNVYTGMGERLWQ